MLTFQVRIKTEEPNAAHDALRSAGLLRIVGPTSAGSGGPENWKTLPGLTVLVDAETDGSAEAQVKDAVVGCEIISVDPYPREDPADDA